MNWMTGFTMGLMLGVSVFMSLLAAQRRRQRQLLEGLLQSGAYRLLRADGNPAQADELLAALGEAPGPALSKGKLAAMIAVAVAAGVISGAALLLTARG